MKLLLAQSDCYSPLLKCVLLFGDLTTRFCVLACRPPFIRLLDSQDEFVRAKSSIVASTLLGYDSRPDDTVVSKLLSHLGSLVRK